MSNPPREFYENMVKPAYSGWFSDPLAEWKAKAAVGYANDLAERVFVYWDDLGDRTHIGGMTSARKYRDHLRNTICPDFGLVWDANDNTKHARLRREPREITTASQTGVGRIGWGEGPYGEGVYGGTDQIVIELDSGEKRALSSVMQNVMAMWERLLTQMGL